MLFQGKDVEVEEVRVAYDETVEVFASFGMKQLSFEDWVQFNNDFYEDREKAMVKWTENTSSTSKKKRGRKSVKAGN